MTAFHVFVGYLTAFHSEFVGGSFYVAGIPQHDRVDDESYGAELVFLTLSAASAKVAVLVGVTANTVFGWRWADPLAGLVIVHYAVREAVETFRPDAHA